MSTFCVSWTIDIESDGSHRDAAKVAAQLCFKAHIAAGHHDSASTFTVIDADQVPVIIDLSDSLSDLNGDYTQ